MPITVRVLTPTTEPTPTPIPTQTPVPVKTIWVAPELPANMHAAMVEDVKQLGQIQPGGIQVQLGTDEMSDIVIDTSDDAAGGIALITRTYAVAAPFPTIADSITLSALTAYWQGDTTALTSLTNDGSVPTLFMDADTRAGLVLLLGEPSASTPIQLVETRDLIATAWATRPSSFAILPFGQLEARWKLIWLDGMNLFDKQLDASTYPLTLHVRAHPRTSEDTNLASQLPASTDRDPTKLSIVAMTGVTALVRGTAVQMERKGITYPAEKIRDWLVTADVTHISNEVSFWDDCPPPTFNDGTSMCSDPKYIELLQYVGADIIELSGNHLWDKGTQHLSPTIKMYEDLGWPYFAGGRTYTESLRPVTMTVDGNRIAFVGCNWFGADWATPTNELPGSALCGADDPHNLDLITPTIKALADDGYLVIATLQYAEFYFYQPTAQQESDFKALRDAGAVVVNGSQGHHVQGFDVSAHGFIHYGTGNLFFGDQFEQGAHQMFVDRHAFYNGKYLGADLRSAFIEDYSQPVPMTPEDRAKLLKTLFEATGY
ncbi:MAG: CapA family protein [Chloroflexi bacterium]|nr:CapA family protein [Chloroflexota bacterium]